jgi:predicted metal-dependent enzyme (double-stranded beta helix superfamily)
MTAVPDAHDLDAMVAAPDHHEVLLENERVRVLDTRLAPGQRTPIHTHASYAALYVMSWSDFVRRDAQGDVIVDSRSRERRPAIGEALWLPPLPAHSVENIGTAELRLIAVELK